MSFRQDGKKAHEWQQWREKHRDELVRSGVPDSVLQTGFHWLRFLEEGSDQQTGWSPDLLSPERVQVLHAFILREYGNERYRVCLRDIEKFLEKHAV
jgi:hypothetical protein